MLFESLQYHLATLWIWDSWCLHWLAPYACQKLATNIYQDPIRIIRGVGFHSIFVSFSIFWLRYAQIFMIFFLLKPPLECWWRWSRHSKNYQKLTQDPWRYCCRSVTHWRNTWAGPTTDAPATPRWGRKQWMAKGFSHNFWTQFLLMFQFLRHFGVKSIFVDAHVQFFVAIPQGWWPGRIHWVTG